MVELAAFSDRDIATRERLEDYAADRIITTPGGLQLQVAMVCDGAGGGEAGELAARLTARTIFEFLEVSSETSVPKLLVKAVEQANKAVYSELHGTGTSTVALAAVHLNDGAPFGRLYAASVGNSRLYLIRQGRMVRLNIDHTLANEYVYAGQMSTEEAEQLQDPEYVTRAIGIGASVSVDIGFYAERGKNFVNSRRAFKIGQTGMLLQEGDTVFAASDGLFPFVRDTEFVQHALDDNVERATRSLMKYAADRAPEDNTSLSMVFVPSRARKAVTMSRLTRGQKAGAGIFLLAALFVIGFLGVQVVAGENQRLAFLVTQTLVQQIILESSYTPTPTPLPPTATPTQSIIVGQVGNRFSLTQSGIRVFNGKFIDPLSPPEINYVSIFGATILEQGLAIQPANLFLQPATSLQLNRVDDQSENKTIETTLGRGADMFANLGDYQSGGISVALVDSPDLTLYSQNTCASVHEMVADPAKPDDTNKVALACYGGGSEVCSYHFPGSEPVLVPPGKEAVLDVDRLELISVNPISQQEVNVYRDMIWRLTENVGQLDCLQPWLDEDSDGINYPLDICPADAGSVAAQGCPDGDEDGVPDVDDQCPVEVGPASNNGCPLPDVDGDGLSGNDDACPFDAGPDTNNGCPTEGNVATEFAATQTALFNQATATPSPSPSPTITRTPTQTPIPLPQANDDFYSTVGDQSLSVGALNGVLINDASNGATLSASNGSTLQSGSFSINSDGSFNYSPPAAFVGSDQFTYTLTNTSGSDSAVVSINVLQPPPKPPIAGFSPSPSSGPAPLTVSFNNTSSGPINTYSWNFGDGGSSTSPSPSHTYASAGTYNVSLTVTGPGGSDTATGTVTVTVPAPVACFSPTSPSITVGGTLTFNSGCSTGTITTRTWSGGDGLTGTGNTIAHTYNTAGTFTVTLTVTGPGGTNSISTTVTVTVPAPVACFAPTNPNITVGGSVTFNSACSTGTITTRTWSGGDGLAGTGNTISHTYNTAGTFTVSLTVTGPGGSDTATGSVTVTVPAPVACFTPLTSTINAGGSQTFDSGCSTGTITSRTWSGGAGLSGTGNTITHTYPTTGTFTVTLTVTGPGGTNAVSGSITVNTPPPPPPVAVNDNYSAVKGSVLTVGAPGVFANDTLNGATATNTNPAAGTLAFTAATGAFTYTPAVGPTGFGTVTFTYTLTNISGTSTATVSICVAPNAVNDGYTTSIGSTLTDPSPGPFGNDIVSAATTLSGFDATSAQGGAVAISTTPPTTGQLTYTPPANFTGTDSFTYTIANGACTDTATVSISVVPVAVGDSGSVSIGGSTTINLIGNDNPNTGVTINSLGAAGAGTLVDNGDGTVTYTHTGTTAGTDTFTYTIASGGQTSNTATVTVNILPIANGDSGSVNIGGSTTINLIGNDNPNTGVTVGIVGGVGAGTLVDNGDGTVTYTHTGTTAGTDSFTYTITSNGQTSNVATVTINILPIANGDSGATTVNGSTTINVIGNDNPNTGATVNITSGPGSGTLVNNGDGTITYTNTGGVAVVDTFTYTITANGQTSGPATVTVTVT